jgi:hypothetical protein
VEVKKVIRKKREEGFVRVLKIRSQKYLLGILIRVTQESLYYTLRHCFGNANKLLAYKLKNLFGNNLFNLSL